MKKSFYILFLVVFGVIFSYSQNIISVVPGEGTLKQAINSANSGDILRLTPGGTYTESTDAGFIISKPITIEVDGDSKAVKPIIIVQRPSSSAAVGIFFMLSNGAAITVRGLEFDGRFSGAVTMTNFCKFDVGTISAATTIKSVKIYNSSIHNLLKDVINGQETAYKGFLSIDTIIINNSVISDIANGAVVHLKSSTSKYVEVKNSTIYKFAPYGFRLLGFSTTGFHTSPYLVIDKITMDNGLTGIKDFIDMEEVEGNGGCLITNSIFSNLNDPASPATQKGLYWKNKEFSLYDSVALVKNVCLWNDGKRDFRLNMFKDTVTMNPGYKDAANGDFTLSANSPLQTFSASKGPIGDPRWGKTTATAVKKVDDLPVSFSLGQNYPNPFNPTTNIKFEIAKTGFVSLTVYNLLGQEVTKLVNENLTPGVYSAEFSGSNFTSGIYFYRLNTSMGSMVKKMTLIK
jgi:hypothetical protein